jgi:hypothetical protein
MKRIWKESPMLTPNVDAFGLGPFWSVFLEGIDP